MKWFTSDLHFGHRKILEYCKRPYASVEEMDEAIIAQWNSQVNPQDIVYVLGDFSINKKKALDAGLVGRLNGTKIIILGNHDYGFNRLHRGENLEHINAAYGKAGWFRVLTEDYHMIGKHQVLLSHLPPISALNYDIRYAEFKSMQMTNTVYLHGHLHAKYIKEDNKIDVGFDGNFRLYSEDDILKLIEDPKTFIPSRLTESTMIPKVLVPFEDEVKKGNVRKVVQGDLVLYNYTDQCTYEKAWNETTLQSRGIIFDWNTGEIVARPFNKFFNLGEMPETRFDALPKGHYDVYEKMDGSLGICYFHNSRWNVATRGSFSSDQSREAEKIIKKYDTTEVNKGYTLLVEIIYPGNKIVVNYGQDEKLVLLGAIETKSGRELSRGELVELSRSTGMPLVPRYYYSIEEMVRIQKSLPKDQEGFVVRYETGLRIKIKGSEYLRIHKLISQMTPLAFWEAMDQGKVKLDYLQELPEEYRKDADELSTTLENAYATLKSRIVAEYQMVMGFVKDQPNVHKELGLYIQTHKPQYGAAYFGLLNGNQVQVDKFIMKQIRPHGNAL